VIVILLRTISALIALIILVTLLTLGGYFVLIPALFITLFAIYEYKRGLKHAGINVDIVTLFIFTLITYGVYYFKVDFAFSSIVVLLMLSLFVRMILRNKLELKDVAYSFLGFNYITMLLIYIVFLSDVEPSAVWYIFLIAFTTDSFAYFVGKKFGKRKLTDISPHKTIEGSIGGIIGCLVSVFIFSYIFNPDILLETMLMALICSPIAQIGDLVGSKIKRTVEIKDFGNIMPGHGGLLDRLDSILLVSPLVYYFMNVIL